MDFGCHREYRSRPRPPGGCGRWRVHRPPANPPVWRGTRRIAAGWWRCASETPQDIFPERVGHYWVWRDERTDEPRLFHDETEVWRVRLAVLPPARRGPAIWARAWTPSGDNFRMPDQPSGNPDTVIEQQVPKSTTSQGLVGSPRFWFRANRFGLVH